MKPDGFVAFSEDGLKPSDKAPPLAGVVFAAAVVVVLIAPGKLKPLKFPPNPLNPQTKVLISHFAKSNMMQNKCNVFYID